MQIVSESWSDDGVTYILLTEGDDGERRGPETFTRRVLKVVYDDGVQARDEGGALMVTAEPKGACRAHALERHRLAHEQRVLDEEKDQRKEEARLQREADAEEERERHLQSMARPPTEKEAGEATAALEDLLSKSRQGKKRAETRP